MFATNLVLLLAFIAMIAGFVWLFRDGEGAAVRPTIVRKRRGQDAEEDGADEAGRD